MAEINLEEGSAERGRLGRDNLLRPRVWNTAHHRHSWFDDASLVPGDISNGGAQCSGVINTNRGDYAQRRIEDIREVKPTSRSNLHHADIYILLAEEHPHQGVEGFAVGEGFIAVFHPRI